jgi:uncharacterized damage-inducible protein DinB
MSRVQVYIKEWEYLRRIAHRTIEIVDKAKAWEYRLAPTEFTVNDTFIHLTRALFEDAGNWYLDDSTSFISTGNPNSDIDRSIDRMIEAMNRFEDADLDREFTFPWGVHTTIEGSIQQTMFHAVGHLAQLRERAGIYSRTR